jgi:hypothetical protein
MSKEKVLRVIWDAHLAISKDDEIEILSGVVDKVNLGNIYAFEIKNVSSGRRVIREIIPRGIFEQTIPQQFNPPIRGFARNIMENPSATGFELVEQVDALTVKTGQLLKKIEHCLDKEIVAQCLNKTDKTDIIASAFRVLEERIRVKIGESYNCYGPALLDKAFNNKNGKLSFGKTDAERESLYLFYRGSIGLFRNPSAHRFLNDYSDFETFEIVVNANLLLAILEKCESR